MCAKLDKEHLIKLTLAVYKVTELFPEEELKSQIRESANRILAVLLYSDVGRPNIVMDLLRLFKEAEVKNWVDSRNFLVLYREYNGLLRQAEQLVAPPGGRNSGKPVENSFKNNHRQEKILEIIKGNGKTKVSDISQLFPQFNRRTLIRDLEKLRRGGEVVRVGNNGRGVYYTRQ